MNSRAARKQKAAIREQQAKNQAWYDRRYNEDATQRADAQRILTLTEESIRKRNRAAAGTQAVMGGTEESVAATKEANNEALANATSAIAAQAEARKDRIEEQYMQRDQALEDASMGLTAQQSANTAAAIQGVGSAAGSIASSLGGIEKKPSATKS